MRKYRSKIFVLFSVLIFQVQSTANAQEKSPFPFHELTIYTIPAPVEFDWSSPNSLLNSYKKGFIANFIQGGDYPLGHMFIKLTTPLWPLPVYKGMASASRKQQQQLVLNEKIGLGILGIGLDGKMETNEKLEQIIRKYSKRNRLAAITYRLSECSAIRILDFIEKFSTAKETGHRQNIHYGGAFWPLFEDEGAGCSAFAVAMLELAGLSDKKEEYWKVDINIPMSLIGGKLNPSNMVTLKNISRANYWDTGTGKPNIDFVPFWIYDPTFVYNWILDQLNKIKLKEYGLYTDASTYRLPHLFADVRDFEPDTVSQIFTKRNDHNFFIEHFRKKNGIKSNWAAK